MIDVSASLPNLSFGLVQPWHLTSWPQKYNIHLTVSFAVINSLAECKQKQCSNAAMGNVTDSNGSQLFDSWPYYEAVEDLNATTTQNRVLQLDVCALTLCALQIVFTIFLRIQVFMTAKKNDQTEHFNRDAKSCCAPVYRELFTRSKGT